MTWENSDFISMVKEGFEEDEDVCDEACGAVTGEDGGMSLACVVEILRRQGECDLESHHSPSKRGAVPLVRHGVV